MYMEKIIELHQVWLRAADLDEDISKELVKMLSDSELMKEAFYKELTFGTGGLRGIMGAGTNRMNIYTVARASQGISDYIIKNYPGEGRKIAVAYDSRIKSELFAKTAAGVFAGNGIDVYIFPELMPTPCLSFAVRKLLCDAGVVLTASHNPAQYNGYKVYGRDGCQITTLAAGSIQKAIAQVKMFGGVRQIPFEHGLRAGRIRYISEGLIEDYLHEVAQQSLIKDKDIEKNVTIVYSPLNGTGKKPVLRILEQNGYTNIALVKEQEEPDGYFKTCPYPNPELTAAMELAIQYAEKMNADLVMATDPDCDRVGIAVKDFRGDFRLLSGNETGMLLLAYICDRRIVSGTMPEDPVMIKTIVTTDMAEQIAKSYGVETINVLTGFKYIGEQIAFLEAAGKEKSYIFGMEESCGYLAGTYVRDKDGINAAFLICEMLAFYKSIKRDLWDKLQELYETYGYYRNTLYSTSFEGAAGFTEMEQVMDRLRCGVSKIGGKQVLECQDYSVGIHGLPRANVLKFILTDHCSLVIRPSGTEPKLKVYVSVCAKDFKSADKIENEMAAFVISLSKEGSCFCV